MNNPVPPPAPAVVMLPGRWFVAACAVAAAAILILGRTTPVPLWLLGCEVLATILGLSIVVLVLAGVITKGMVP